MAIYFIQCREWVKIGFASNAASRFNQVQCHSPYKLELVGTFEGDKRTEAFLHAKYRGLRGRGEWFFCDGDLKQLIARIRNPEERATVAWEIKNYRTHETHERRAASKLSGYLSDDGMQSGAGYVLSQ